MKSNLSLFEIASEFRAMEAQLRELDLDDETITDTLSAENGDLIDKLCAVMAVSLSMEAEAESVQGYVIARAQARVVKLQKRAARLRQFALDAMLLTKQLSVDSPELKFRVRENPESVDITDESLVDAIFKSERKTTVIDKTAIKAALKRQEQVSGAVLKRGHRVEVL